MVEIIVLVLQVIHAKRIPFTGVQLGLFRIDAGTVHQQPGKHMASAMFHTVSPVHHSSLSQCGPMPLHESSCGICTGGCVCVFLTFVHGIRNVAICKLKTRLRTFRDCFWILFSIEIVCGNQRSPIR